MKTSILRKSSSRKEVFEKLKFKNKVDLATFRKVIKQIHLELANAVVESQEGFSLPNGLGRLIILKNKAKNNLYSAPKQGKKILNLHSFGYVYGVKYKERFLLKYPYLYRFRPHRENIKMKLYDHIMNNTKDYFIGNQYV